MQFGHLESGTFIRRYKRFLVDVALEDGTILTLHCPNTGTMTGCLQEGATAYFSRSNNPQRKYPHTLEWLAFKNGSKACINTQRPNQLINEAIENGTIKELQGYRTILSEQKYGDENSRVDLLLKQHQQGLPNCYVEVKNVTLYENQSGYFPDAVSIRALKHIRELLVMINQGYRAALLFCINHSMIEVLKPADNIQLDYGELLRTAHRSGLELYAYQTEMDPKQISIVRPIPINLEREY